MQVRWQAFESCLMRIQCALLYSPGMKPRDVIRALEADGWAEVRSRGSHRQFRHPSKPGLVTVAVHGNRDLMPRDVASIERQSGMKLRKE
ncbi:MAG TPA: type II toxin-antitoxin system HicA family toxin [Acetobacteraceae bacterium]|nr:type II toxin-antitoxin system HicA family toxin [Acetobacteraceae bacterium]